MSLPRYAACFILIPLLIRKRLEKEYYLFIQDVRRKTLDYNFYACLLRDKGGIGYIDLRTIYKASIVIIVARAVAKPKLAQVVLTREIILKYASRNVLEEAVNSPQIQSFSLNIRYIPNYLYSQQTTQASIYNLYNTEQLEVVLIL